MADVLSRIPEADCIRLCHRVVDSLCGRERPRWGDYSHTWSLQVWSQLLDALTAIFLAVGHNVSDEEVLVQLSGAGSSHAQVVLRVLRARQEEIRSVLLNRTNTMSSATLQDFDWQLKLALSSDKIASLNAPLLSLSLDVMEDGGCWPVAMEMNIDELSMLITSLEAANKVVLQLK